MKKLFLPLMAIALCGTIGCSKDEETPDPINSATPDSYVLGVYNPAHHLSSYTENGITYNMVWSDEEQKTLQSFSIGPVQNTLQYDNQNRLTEVRIANHDERMCFVYSGNALSQMNLMDASGDTVYHTSVSCNNNRITAVNYREISSDYVMGYLENYLGLEAPKGLELSVTNLSTNYSWSNNNLTIETMHGEGHIQVPIGPMVDLLGLDTNVYRMLISSMHLDTIPGIGAMITPQLIDDFVTLLRDSNAVITGNVNIQINYAYDNHENPLYGFLANGLIGNAHLLSHNNMLSNTHTGAADLTIRVGIPPASAASGMMKIILALLQSAYPDGLSIPYSLPLNSTEAYSYTYNENGWPTSATKSGIPVLSYTYGD